MNGLAGDGELLTHQRNRRYRRRQQCENERGPSSLVRCGSGVGKQPGGALGRSGGLLKGRARAFSTHALTSIFLTCQMNLDSATGPVSASGYWSRG